MSIRLKMLLLLLAASLSASLATRPPLTYQTFVGNFQDGYNHQQPIVLSGKNTDVHGGVSLCIRINSTMIQTSTDYFVLVTNKNSVSEEWGYIRPNGLIKFADILYSYTYSWQTYLWYNICILWSSNSSIRLVINKQDVVATNLTNINSSSVLIRDQFVSSIVLGRGSYSQITDFQIWNKVIDNLTLDRFQGCKQVEGNIFSWQLWEATQKNNQHLFQGEYELCSSPGFTGFTDLIKSVQMSYTDATSFCKKLGGELLVPQNEEELHSLLDRKQHDKYSSLSSCNFGGYTGLRKVPLTKRLVKDLEGTEESKWWSKHWHPLSPNGGDQQTCVLLNLTDQYFDDVSCDIKHCSLCHFKTMPVYSTRGLCEKEDYIRWQFKMSETQDINNRYLFSGLGPTYMMFNTSTQTFEIVDIFTRRTLASKRLERGYPFGTWQLLESPCLENSHKEPVLLDISRCNATQFTCSDSSSCIDLELKCDGRMHCKDNSDELMCSRILEYIGKSPPPKQGGLRSTITLDVRVPSIIDIDESNELMRIQALVYFEWYDQRLSLLNLNHDSKLNVLSETEVSKIWTPSFLLNNTLGKDTLAINNNTVVKITRKGQPSVLAAHYIDNSLVFSGAENPLHGSTFIVKDFLCSFSLGLYPFDTQTCTMDFTVPPSVTSYLVIDEKSYARYLGTSDSGKFSVHRVSTACLDCDPGKQNTMSLFRVSITVKRRVLNTVVNTFLPTILIIIVVSGTSFYNMEHFEAAAAVNITSTLVLMTIMMQLKSSLPKSTPNTLLDVWMIFCLSSTASILYCHIWIEYFSKEAKHVQPNKVATAFCGSKDYSRKLSRANFLRFRLLPSLIGVFAAGYFAVGLTVQTLVDE